MSGFFYALAAALFASTSDALCKKALGRDPALVIAWARFAGATPFLLASLLFVDLPAVDSMFWILLACLVPLEILAVWLYMSALQASPLSLTVPFLALTPVFTTVTSFVLLGEMPDRSGLTGIFHIVLGAYLLHVHLTPQGILEPLRAVWQEKGSRRMIGVALVYSVTSNLGKMAVQHSSASFMAAVYLPVLSVAFLPLLRWSGVRPGRVRSGWGLFFLIGASQALMAFFHFHAISLILVSYMICVKRLSLVLSVVFGWLFFQESRIEQRLLGSLLMLAGVVLILV